MDKIDLALLQKYDLVIFLLLPPLQKGWLLIQIDQAHLLLKAKMVSWDSSYNSEAGNGGFIGVITQPIDYNIESYIKRRFCKNLHASL